LKNETQHTYQSSKILDGFVYANNHRSIPEISTKPAHPHQHLQIVYWDAWVMTFDSLFVGEGGFEWNI
jgi:hypothetical protein